MSRHGFKYLGIKIDQAVRDKEEDKREGGEEERKEALNSLALMACSDASARACN